MPVHDAYARLTPYELLLPEEGFAEERFPAIREEAQERAADLTDPDRFALLSQVALALRDIRPPDDDPRLIQQHGALLFHAFHSWEAGLPLFLLSTPAARYLVAQGPEPGQWRAALPGTAGYVQLPQYLFWVAGGEGAPAEAVDGFFWSAPSGDDLALLMVMGMRRDRPGLSVVPLPVLPLSAAGEWASLPVRPDGDDFVSSLPGTELEQLFELRSGAEALKLAMRVFWHLDTVAGSVEEGMSGGEAAPVPSKLPYRRIVRGAG